MTSPLQFKFLLDHVEAAARRTGSILYHDSEDFWDDIVETYDRREEKANYWMFCTRWMRENLVDTMNLGSPRALVGILATLRPNEANHPTGGDTPGPETKRRTIARLLPIMMREMTARVSNASESRHGPDYDDVPSYHSEDHSW
ncbi:MAG: hypothetical protein HKN82_18225 [Akkermansiaceae bacterium]|nr:hypothetical protein [Akkermansiaceae bacterium]